MPDDALRSDLWQTEAKSDKFALHIPFSNSFIIHQVTLHKGNRDRLQKGNHDFEVRQKYSAASRIFNCLLGVWKCGQTRSFVFGISNHFV